MRRRWWRRPVEVVVARPDGTVVYRGWFHTHLIEIEMPDSVGLDSVKPARE